MIDVREVATTRPGPALAALSVGTFAIGMTEFVITGLLPDIAGDLYVSIPTAGLLISGYALSVVIGGPLVTALLSTRARKPALVGLLAFFVIGNAMSAVASGYPLMMAGRVVAALCHGAFIGFATVVAGDLLPDRRSRAIGAMLAGLTLSTVAGVPLGTLLGQQLGWRATFWTMAGLGLLAALATALFVPHSRPAGHRAGHLGAFRHAQLWLALAMTACAFGAVYAPFTYVAPLMTEVAGYSEGALPWLLALFGTGLVLGNVIGARAADRRLMGTIVGASVAMLAVLLIFPVTARSPLAAAVTLFVLGVVAYATVPGLTNRVLVAAGPDGQNLLASSAAVSAFNLGNAAGAYLGGRAIAAGWGYRSTPLVGAAMEVAALVLAVILVLLARRPRPVRTGAASAVGD
ncbi:MFS transporter [Actinoplanes teichomyceticus]|uniref:DHA1 family inner membrane transport protein n=1 Tax=Actinoplanes teichomyceticus TaxID=1867 RepID=A0A561WSN7_ACTTI|nr:MFS transporter [Actinoplanes teichomyceticus]TWG26863.1 DHA1 family inner membrane transport protein [Actinoplanes teichomyceticus]GIF15264.1 MFS transporter [Actinoplanes teichomyceticus]